MIKNSFVFLEKVGRKKERALWRQEIRTWDNFLHTEKVRSIALEKKGYYDRQIRRAQRALYGEDSSFFIGKLPPREMWRLYPEFREECGFLDLETDSQGRITVVGISNYFNTLHFVKGFNLERKSVEKELSKYKIMITFNGGAFDLPKLQKQLGAGVGVPHIDLKPLCIALGLKGGLKEVERRLNLKRPSHLYGNPVELWKAFHASGDREYLDLLLQYNAEDIENLKRVMDWCYKEMVQRLTKDLNQTEK